MTQFKYVYFKQKELMVLTLKYITTTTKKILKEDKIGNV
jgi:hypothetical protein